MTDLLAACQPQSFLRLTNCQFSLFSHVCLCVPNSENKTRILIKKCNTNPFVTEPSSQTRGTSAKLFNFLNVSPDCIKLLCNIQSLSWMDLVTTTGIKGKVFSPRRPNSYWMQSFRVIMLMLISGHSNLLSLLKILKSRQSQKMTRTLVGLF